MWGSGIEEGEVQMKIVDVLVTQASELLRMVEAEGGNVIGTTNTSLS